MTKLVSMRCVYKDEFRRGKEGNEPHLRQRAVRLKILLMNSKLL